MTFNNQESNFNNNNNQNDDNLDFTFKNYINQNLNNNSLKRNSIENILDLNTKIL